MALLITLSLCIYRFVLSLIIGFFTVDTPSGRFSFNLLVLDLNFDPWITLYAVSIFTDWVNFLTVIVIFHLNHCVMSGRPSAGSASLLALGECADARRHRFFASALLLCSYASLSLSLPAIRDGSNFGFASRASPFARLLAWTADVPPNVIDYFNYN